MMTLLMMMMHFIYLDGKIISISIFKIVILIDKIKLLN